MALIFSRLARNFIKNGYFPTDEVTLERIIGALDVGGRQIRVLDPCCGEGTALAEIKHHLAECGAVVDASGIEFDQERAWHAKGILNQVAHSDMHDVFITARSQSLLFLNPPYGDVISDKGMTGDRTKKDRLEKQFYRKTINWLQFGGVMVLIVPSYVLDDEFATMIARNFERVSVFLSPVTTYKQAVVFGVKKRSDSPAADVINLVLAFGRGERADQLPEDWRDEPYLVPEVVGEANFYSIRIDGKQLEVEMQKHRSSTLWPQFGRLFGNPSLTHRPPLRRPSKWHMALALAAGQVTGVVKSNDGRQLLIKGNTHKEKEVVITVDEENDYAETRVLTDRFVPVITGIDFTEGPGYGNLITIR